MNSYAILLVTASWVSGSAGEAPAEAVCASKDAVVQCCHKSRCCDTGHSSVCHRPVRQPRGCVQPCESVVVDKGCCPCKQVLGDCCCRKSLLRRLLDRLKNCRLCCRRHRCKAEPVVCHVIQAEPAPCKPAPAPAPEPVKKAPEPPKAEPKPAPPPPAAFEIKKEYLPKVGNAADYSWVTGQLFYIHAEGGIWLVRYAPHEKEDRYGGSVVLAPSINMASYQEGDLVTVRGDIIHDGRASKYLGGPPYRPSGMDLVERLK